MNYEPVLSVLVLVLGRFNHNHKFRPYPILDFVIPICIMLIANICSYISAEHGAQGAERRQDGRKQITVGRENFKQLGLPSANSQLPTKRCACACACACFFCRLSSVVSRLKARTLFMETINEPIDVSAVFKAGRLQPASFMWRRRLYKVRLVTGHYSNHRGKWKQYHYAIRSDTEETYEICLDTEHMEWQLIRVHA